MTYYIKQVHNFLMNLTVCDNNIFSIVKRLSQSSDSHSTRSTTDSSQLLIPMQAVAYRIPAIRIL